MLWNVEDLIGEGHGRFQADGIAVGAFYVGLVLWAEAREKLPILSGISVDFLDEIGCGSLHYVHSTCLQAPVFEGEVENATTSAFASRIDFPIDVHERLPRIDGSPHFAQQRQATPRLEEAAFPKQTSIRSDTLGGDPSDLSGEQTSLNFWALCTKIRFQELDCDKPRNQGFIIEARNLVGDQQELQEW